MSDSIFGYDAPRRKTLSLRKRLWLWDNARSQGLSKTCNICRKRITTFGDMELDHVKAYSKGGTKLAMVHKACNRIKSGGGLRELQKSLGIKTPIDQRKQKLKPFLETRTIKQLKQICDKLYIKKPKGSGGGDYLFASSYSAPNKSSYIRAIIKSDAEIARIKAAGK